MTYKIVVYGREIETEEYEDLQELITQVHYLLEHKLAKGKVSSIYVSVK